MYAYLTFTIYSNHIYTRQIKTSVSLTGLAYATNQLTPTNWSQLVDQEMVSIWKADD